MLDVANRAYLGIWCRDFSEGVLLERFRDFLETVPFSASRPGFTYLVVRAVAHGETPVLERDLRPWPLDAAGLVEIAAEHLNSDSVYETETHWDLWAYDPASSIWRTQPQRLELFCYGEDYDEGTWQENGHLHVDVGFEHLFTGHGGLLGFRGQPAAEPQHPAEADFIAAMSRPENLRAYHEKTRDNIRKLYDWIERLQAALPVQHYRLWSEGEENFEARLEEILAVR
jgi:hypothetical protein